MIKFLNKKNTRNESSQPGRINIEVEIIEWLVADGDYVQDQSVEIDSDKATLELPAEESGVIKILARKVTVSVGDGLI